MKKNDSLTQACVAYLTARGLSQQEIADKLKIPQAAVSRFLTSAKKSGMLTLQAKIPEEHREEVNRRCAGREEKLLHEFAMRAELTQCPSIAIFSSGQAAGDDELARRAKIRVFTDNAATHLRQLMATCTRFGLTWGHMLRSVVDSMGALSSPWAQRIEVIPLAGDPIFKTLPAHAVVTRYQRVPATSDTGSSYLAADLARIINGVVPAGQLSIAAVPSLIPEDFEEADRDLDGPSTAPISRSFDPETIRKQEVIREYIRMIPAYQQIFGKHALVDNGLEAIFTSVGPARHMYGWEGSTLVTPETVSKLRERAHGDIGGVLIPKDGFQADAEILKVSRLWTGLKIKNLEDCRRNAVLSRSPGVVVICQGPDRAEFIFEVLTSSTGRRGLINHLIVDDTFALRFFALVNGFLQR